MASSAFSVEDLQYTTPEFDPTALRCKLQLAAKLGLNQTARIEALRGHSGGLNQGMWTLCEGSQVLILKLVRSRRHHPAIPTETENFLKLAKDYPSLVHDTDLAFPMKIFHCRGPAGNSNHDLIVMHKAPGETFTNIINRKAYCRQLAELMDHFEALGHFLASFHNMYGLQHGDFQPSNVFFDEATGRFTMIDIADLSPRGAQYGVQESDVEHFCTGARLIARCHGDQLQSEVVRRFQAGYSKCRSSPM